MSESGSGQGERLPEAEAWGFGQWDKDHLALLDADTSLCGRHKDPHSFPTLQRFDVTANFSCRRCLATLRRIGPVRVYFRTDIYYELRSHVVGPEGAQPEEKTG